MHQGFAWNENDDDEQVNWKVSFYDYVFALNGNEIFLRNESLTHSILNATPQRHFTWFSSLFLFLSLILSRFPHRGEVVNWNYSWTIRWNIKASLSTRDGSESPRSTDIQLIQSNCTLMRLSNYLLSFEVMWGFFSDLIGHLVTRYDGFGLRCDFSWNPFRWNQQFNRETRYQ